MDVTCAIESAKCCVANLAGAYVDAKNTGQNNDNMFNEFMLMNSYVKVLCNYDPCKPKGNCLCETEVKFIISQIKLSCESCACDC